MKKYRILIFTIIMLMLMSICLMPVSAKTYDYISIYDEYEDLMATISYEEMGISSGDELWSEVVANYHMGDVSTDYHIFEMVTLNGIGEVVVFWTYWYDEIETDKMFKFYLMSEDHQYVTSSENVGNGFYYAMPVYCDDHEYEDISVDVDDYCYYEMCVNCGYEHFREHDYVLKDEIEPTCISVGTEVWECHSIGCGHEMTKELPKVAHTFDNGVVITDPTCTEDGIRKYTCDVCDYSYQATINALGHDYNSFGNCRRSGCSNNYFGFKLDFSWLTDWFSKGQDTIDDVGTKIEEWTEDVFDGDGLFGGDDSTDDDSKTVFDEIKELFDKASRLMDKLLSLIMGAVVGYIVVKCIPIVVGFFKKLFGIKDKRR